MGITSFRFGTKAVRDVNIADGEALFYFYLNILYKAILEMHFKPNPVFIA